MHLLPLLLMRVTATECLLPPLRLLPLSQAYLPEGLPEECENSVSFWLAVTDVPVEAGCLRFIPGSHLQDLRRHTPGKVVR